MAELGTRMSASECRLALGWVGMTIMMPFAVATIDFLEPSLQTVYVFAAGVTLQEAIRLAVWALRR